MGRQPPSKRFFHTTCDRIVYFKTCLLSIILGHRIYPRLEVTLLLKEGYIVHHSCQTNQVKNDSKAGTTKGKVASNWFEICGKGRQCFQNSCLQTIGISTFALSFKVCILPVTISLKELVISNAIQRGRKRHKIHRSKLKCLTVITA